MLLEKNLITTCLNSEKVRLPFGPHSVIWSDVDSVSGRVMADSQTQVGDAAGPVLLHQNVL